MLEFIPITHLTVMNKQRRIIAVGLLLKRERVSFNKCLPLIKCIDEYTALTLLRLYMLICFC